MNSALLTAALSAMALAGLSAKLKTVLLVVLCIVYGLCSLLLIVAVLLQESKGGGLAAPGGTRAESAFGASNPLRRMTTILSVVFLVLSGVLSLWLAPESTKFKKEDAGDEKAPAGAPEKPGDKKPVEATVPIPSDEPAKDAPADAPKDAPKEAPKDAPKDAPKADEKPAPTEKPAEAPAETEKPADPPAGAP